MAGDTRDVVAGFAPLVPFMRRDVTVDEVVVVFGLAINDELTVVFFTVVVVMVDDTVPIAVFGRAAATEEVVVLVTVLK